jgi:hypothetical protein
MQVKEVEEDENGSRRIITRRQRSRAATAVLLAGIDKKRPCGGKREAAAVQNLSLDFRYYSCITCSCSNSRPALGSPMHFSSSIVPFTPSMERVKDPAILRRYGALCALYYRTLCKNLRMALPLYHLMANNPSLSTWHMVGFIDDCAQRTNDFQADPQPTAAVLCVKMQEEAQIWNNLLFVSGGALEIPKCSFHWSNLDQDQNCTPILKTGKTAPNIFIMNGLVPSQVKQKCNLRSHKTLGCKGIPGNLMIAQKAVMEVKSDEYATTVATNILQRKESRTMYTSMYCPAVTYPMPVTSLTPAECESIQHKCMQQNCCQLGLYPLSATVLSNGLEQAYDNSMWNKEYSAF